ncbi:MAG: PKD domain-containing protein [Deltaproteobacteria bacterium]|nr:PKD domain-containing protein [Deltaproteobacteria bacterium]
MLRACAVLLLGVACSAPPPPPVVTANQEPVALIAVPAEAAVGVPCAFDAASSNDVDGRVVAWSLSFGDDSAPAVITDGAAPTWQHEYQRAGRFVVQLEVTDDQGLVGRARVPLAVAPPPELGPPTVDELAVTQGGALLAARARVAVGSALEVTVGATDPEGHLESALVELGEQAVAVDLASSATTGSGSATVSVPATPGDALVRASAVDRYGNRSTPREHALLIVDAATDTDGDGLPDLVDPAPDVENGLLAEAFLLDALFDDGTIPTDLFGNQRAERVLEALGDATPVASAARTDSFLARAPGIVALDDLVPGAPAATGGFVVRYSGFLVPPQDVDALIVEIEADDVGVVLLDGAVVASADEEYARDFFRFDRAPTRTDEIALDGRTPIAIVVGDGAEAPTSWSVRLELRSGGQQLLAPEAVGVSSFTLR